MDVVAGVLCQGVSVHEEEVLRRSSAFVRALCRFGSDAVSGCHVSRRKKVAQD